MNDVAPEFGGSPKIFQPHRDIKFSSDKIPSKLTVSGYLEGMEGVALLYAELSVDGLTAATGYYKLAPDQMAKYRETLLDEPGEEQPGATLRRIIQEDRVMCEGPKTSPRQVPTDHKNLDLLRWTSMTALDTLRFEECNAQGCPLHVISTWRRGERLNLWLNRYVGPSRLG